MKKLTGLSLKTSGNYSLISNPNYKPRPARSRKSGQKGKRMEVTEMRFENLLDAVEWAEENIKDGFEIIRDKDNTYIVREVL